jgi:phage regulator Rha-like protein
MGSGLIWEISRRCFRGLGNRSMATKKLILIAAIETRILVLRGERVMLDSELAELYGVATKALNQAVRRNSTRFPRDFMFQLTSEEVRASRSQSVTLKRGENVKYRPYVFTEQGVAMLSSVLRSERAIAANVAIMRAFVRMREVLATHKELAKQLAALERRIDSQDDTIVEIVQTIRQLMVSPHRPPEPKRPRIGFV